MYYIELTNPTQGDRQHLRLFFILRMEVQSLRAQAGTRY